MPRRAHDFRGLTQPRRLRLLHAIQQTPGRSAGELAEQCGIPLNTVRDHVRVLMDEGLIRSESLVSGRRGRPPLVFHPVHDVASSTVARARVEGAISRGRMLRAMSREPPSGLEADALRQVDVLYEHLDDAGLNPVVDEKYLRFELTPCRYHDLLDADQELVCGVHAQLVRDVLRQSDGPLEVKRLEPFVTPHTCRLLLTRGAPRAGEGDE